jgi:predicted glycosyltransferase
MFEEEPPDIAVSHRSVELCRVAFGLGIPVVSTHDTVHNNVISKLTMPLTDILVVSRAIPERFYSGYGITKMFRFDGVDEVAWMKDFKSFQEMEYGKPLIVVRQMETRAVYTVGKTDVTEKLAHKLTSLGKVVFLPRYDSRPREGLIVPERFVDSASLVGCADLVLSIGGTLAREAALQGTPSLVIRPIGASYVNNYLSEKGFPLFTIDQSEVLTYARKYVGKIMDVEDLLTELEDPVDVIERVVEEEICDDSS